MAFAVHLRLHRNVGCIPAAACLLLLYLCVPVIDMLHDMLRFSTHTRIERVAWASEQLSLDADTQLKSVPVCAGTLAAKLHDSGA